MTIEKSTRIRYGVIAKSDNTYHKEMPAEVFMYKGVFMREYRRKVRVIKSQD